MNRRKATRQAFAAGVLVYEASNGLSKGYMRALYGLIYEGSGGVLGRSLRPQYPKPFVVGLLRWESMAYPKGPCTQMDILWP